MFAPEAIDIEAGWTAIVGECDRDHYVEWLYKLTLLAKSPKEELTILYASEGGDVDYALAIFDLIKSSKKRIRILVNGPCQSAATLILQAAHVRQCTANSSFLVHYGSMPGDSESETKFNLAQHERWCRMFADRTGLSLKKSKSIHAVETYLTAEQALKLGMIDEVLP